MRFVLIFLLSTLSHQAAAADYESAVPLEDGDVISADVMNDILERIELTLKPVTADELNETGQLSNIFVLTRGSMALKRSVITMTAELWQEPL